MGRTASVGRSRIGAAFAILVLWVSVTLVGGKLLTGGRVTLLEMITHGVAFHILFACLLLLVAVVAFGWRDMGFRAPTGTLRILWPALLYFVIQIALIVGLGVPPVPVIALVLLNTLLVGISEELMFRGVLFRALRTRLAIWPAILVTSALFGLVHVANMMFTGELLAAIAQAGAAFSSGLLLMAIMLRTGSIWPAIAYHAVWDGASFLVLVAMGSEAGRGVTLTASQLMLPLLLVLPNGLYGLYLLRNIARTEKNPTPNRHDIIANAAADAAVRR